MSANLPVPWTSRALGAPGRDPGAAALAAQRPSHARAPRLERITCLDQAAGVLAAAGGRVCCLWALNSAEPFRRLVRDEPIQAVWLTRDGKALAIAAGTTVAVFDMRSGHHRFDIAHDAEVTSVHADANGRSIATADVTGRVLLHAMADGRRRLDLAFPPGRPLVFVHRAGYLMVESHTHSTLVDTRSGTALRRFDYAGGTHGEPGGPLSGTRLVAHHGAMLRWFDCGRSDGPYCTRELGSTIRNIDIHGERGLVLAATESSGLHLFELDTGQPVGRHESFTTPVTFARFAPDASLLVAGGEALVQHLRGGVHVGSYYDETRPLVAMAHHAGRHELFVTDRDGGAARVSLDSGHGHRPSAGHTGSVSVVLPTADWAATGAYDGTVRVTPHGTGGPTVMALDEGPVQSLALDADGRTLWVGTWAGRVSACDVATGERRLSVKAGSSSIRTLAFDAGFRRLAVGGDDGELRVLDPRDGGRLLVGKRQLGCPYHARWDGEGNLMVTDLRGVSVYRGDDLALLRSCPSNGDEVRWFDLAGGRLAVLSLGGALTLRDAATFELRAQRQLEPSGHHRSVVLLGPDRIATASADGLVRVFDARLEPVATLELLRRGWLWATPPRDPHPGWLHTDRPDLLDVGDGVAGSWRAWPADDPRRERYLATRNSPGHVMTAVNGRAEGSATAAPLALPGGRVPAGHRLGWRG